MKLFGPIFQCVILAIFLLLPSPVVAEEEKTDNAELTNEIYIDVPPLTVTMYHKGRPKGNMTVRAKLKVVDKDQRALAQKYLPRLSSAYVMESNRLSHDYFDINQPVNIIMLGNAFQQSTNRLLGHKDAKLLIEDVVVNKR